MTGIGLLAFSCEGGAVCVWKAHKKINRMQLRTGLNRNRDLPLLVKLYRCPVLQQSHVYRVPGFTVSVLEKKSS